VRQSRPLAPLQDSAGPSVGWPRGSYRFPTTTHTEACRRTPLSPSETEQFPGVPDRRRTMPTVYFD